ncbi:hypothetical protein DFH94DRAFT_691258 [Russula ochroleuca]|uniref:TauD/TfdA-like domain-containing protein n=1 Tax=Russula ochroleuca TaxID=152965 RepID=A0A9P5MXY1_9AGAM|nr:hypothetical protein DFH94DRAFT_691258 [Russula ochroleuca]
MRLIHTCGCSPSAAHSTGLAIESEGKELLLGEPPPWTEDKIKVFPVTWKSPVTGALHFQVHPCAAQELLIDPLFEGALREGALYPDGAHITDLKEVRDLLYKMQRPAMAVGKEKDLALFHNRGVLHTVVGASKPDQVRAFHQCNLAASDEPVRPTPEDVRQCA